MAKPGNVEREGRILDAAAGLFVRFGYDKTTVSDIARAAGVSKGAIYLHFESKDALFEGLLVRELQVYAERWLELITADPGGGTIAGLYKNSLYALSSSPFMAAMYKQDRHVFGTYLRKPDNFFRKYQTGQGTSARYEFVKMMQATGAIRPELDAKVTAHIMDILAYGLVSMDEIMAAEDIPPTEDLIEGIADFMDRALTPDDGGSSTAGKAIIQQLAEAGRLRLQEMENRG